MKNGLNNETLSLFNDVLASLKMSKQAAVKSAVGETTHPVKNVDDGTTPADEGARSEENTSDVKEELGSGGVTGQEDAESVKDVSTEGGSEGTQPQASDEVKGNVPTPKSTVDKPGKDGLGDSSEGHPSNQTFEEKYSSVRNLGNKIAADIAMLAKEAKAAPKAEVKAPVKVEKKAEVKTEKKAALEKVADFLQGYRAAEALDQSAQTQAQMGKQAAAQMSSEIVKKAEKDAEAYCEFLKGYVEARQGSVKKAEHVKLSEEDKFKIGYEIGTALRKEAAAGTLTEEKVQYGLSKLAEMTGEEVAPEELAALMGAEGGAPEGMPVGAPEGMPEEGMISPEELEAGAGAEGGDEAPASEEELMALAQVLDEAGVTPEELIASMEEAQGGAGAEVAPEEDAVAAEAAADEGQASAEPVVE